MQTDLNLARIIDISCVQAWHDSHDVRRLAETAIHFGFVAAHVLPNRVALARDLLAGSSTAVGVPLGFPSGGTTTSAKILEAAVALQSGAQELDFVAPIGFVRSRDREYVVEEFRSLLNVVDGAAVLRVILEVGYLSDDDLRFAGDCVAEAGLPWVKTGTGWSGVPTTEHHIRLIRERVGDHTQIKASGGIRDVDTIDRMRRLGVSRFGMNTSAAVSVIAPPTGDQQ